MLVFKVVRKQRRIFTAAMAASLFVIYFVGNEKPDEAHLPELRIVYVRNGVTEDEDLD